jgi:hypothetical protein
MLGGGGLFFLTIAIFSQILPGIDSHGRPAERSLLILLGFLGFAMLGVFLYVVWAFDRVTIAPDRLVYRTVLGRGQVPWGDIAHVGYSRPNAWFLVRTMGGRTARISDMMTGVPEFARMMIRQVPVERVDPDAYAILELAAQVR